MKRTLNFAQTVGFIFTAILGVILHFLYDWTGQNVIIGTFSAVNESIFEHMKLLFFPMFLFSLIEKRFVGKDYENFWCAKLFGIVLGVLLIPVLYYTIRGVFGMIPDWVNIVIFFITDLVSYVTETRLLTQNSKLCESSKTAFLLLVLIALVFVAFTFAPPQIPLFEDPITKTYGI